MKRLLGLASGVNRTILANAGSVAGATAITSGLGFAYWWVAARAFPAEAVGLAAAAISAMTLLANMATLGLGTWLMGELPRRPGNAATLISTMFVVSGLAGAILGVVFALVLPRFSAELSPLSDSLPNMVLFAAGVSLTTASLVLDQALIGLLRGHIQMARNALFALLKLVALVIAGAWLGQSHGLAIYATWVFGIGISCAWLAVRPLARGLPLIPRMDIVRHHLPEALQHHALNLALQVPGLALPMVVALVLSSAMNAYFYTAWMILGIVATAPFALTLALYAVGSSDPARFVHRIRFTLLLAFAAAVAANFALGFGADLVLGIFGRAYAVQGAESLRILGLATFGLIVKDHYVAVHRVNARVSRAAVLVSIGGAIELAGALLGATRGGLVGLSLGWVIAVYIEAAWMARSVLAAALPSASTLNARPSRDAVELAPSLTRLSVPSHD